MWISDQMTWPFVETLQAAGFKKVEVFVWHKPNTMNEGGPRSIWSFEKYILASNHNEHAAIWNLTSSMSLLRCNVWTFDAVVGGQFETDSSTGLMVNKCQKPILLRYHELFLFVKKGSLVLDFCCGTGSLTQAALFYGCNVIACDLRCSQTDHLVQTLRALPETSQIPVQHYDLHSKPQN